MIAERANSTASSTISPETPMWFIGSNIASSCSAEKAAAISFEISQKIQNEMTYPGQVKVTVIRETRAVNYAK